MSVTSVGRALPTRVLGTVTIGAGLLLVAGLVGAAAPVLTVALASGVALTLPGVALVCLGWGIRVTKRRRGVEAEPIRDGSACRCAGLFGMGVLGAGATAACLPLFPPGDRQPVAAAGVTVVALLFILGLLQTPGMGRTLAGRLRLALDGLGIGLLLALIGWLLVPGIRADHSLAYTATVIAATCAAVTAAAVMQALRKQEHKVRGVVLRCGGGAALAVVGLALVVAAVEPGAPRWALPMAGALVVCGPPVIWAGVRRVDPLLPAGRDDATGPAEGLAGFPMLAVPLGAAALAVAYHLVVVGMVSYTAVVLGVAASGVLAVREVLAAAELRRCVRQLTAQQLQMRDLVADLRQRRDLELKVHQLACTDQRTGLPNRRELVRAMAGRQAGVAGGLGRHRGALIVIELNGLQAVNDLRGHAASDAVLVEAARRLRGLARVEDLPARLEGGDRFAVITESGPIEAYSVAVRLVAALARPYELPSRPAHLTASGGLTALDAEPEEVLHRAGLALRRAYQLGRNQVEWYDDGLQEHLVRRLDMERHLPGAAGRGELDLAFQPVAELDSERPVGVEALLRWRHPVVGRVLPGELIPIADQVRVGGEIGEWVLHTACRRVAGWRRGGHDLWLGINLSARQLADPELVPGVAAALSVHQTPPERLTVEISTTEIGAALPTVAAQLGKVRGLGVRTALDRVGAGETDLAWLRRLPLDMVKLVTPAATREAAGVTSAVVGLSRRLGLTVVASQLETEAQRELVRGAGCRYGQGYLVAPPARAERFEAYLNAVRRDVEKESSESSSP